MNARFRSDNRRQSRSPLLRGMILEQTLLVNPVTGNPIPFCRQELTLSDPRSGAVVIIEHDPVIQCCLGDVIQSGERLAFCWACGEPVCTRHSIQDPFCGRIFCLPHSHLIDLNGLVLRICPECYRRLREKWFQRALRLLLGRK